MARKKKVPFETPECPKEGDKVNIKVGDFLCPATCEVDQRNGDLVWVTESGEKYDWRKVMPEKPKKARKKKKDPMDVENQRAKDEASNPLGGTEVTESKQSGEDAEE